MTSSVDRRTGSRADRSRSPSLPRLRWPSEQGQKPQSETNLDRGALPDRAASKPLTQPTRTSSDRSAHQDFAAFKPSRRDVEKLVPSRAPESAPREEPLPSGPLRPASSLRQTERLLQDRFILEGLRQLGLAIAIVLVLGFVSVRMFSPREAGVVPAEDRAARAQSPATAAATPNQAPIPLPAGPQLNVESDGSAPAGQPAALRLTVSDAPEGSTIVVSGVGPDTTLSAGESRDVEWRLGLADLSNLSVVPPKDFVGAMVLGVELRLPDGRVAGRRSIKLEWTGEAVADRANEAAPASAPPPAPSETPVAAKAAPEAAPAAEAVKEKRVARAAPPQVETPAQAEPAREAAAARAEPGDGETSVTPCFAKLDGKVVLQGNCRTVWTERKSVTFESGEKRLSLTFDHGRVWRLNWNGEDKGKIFKREDCWGNEKAYVCEHGLKAKSDP